MSNFAHYAHSNRMMKRSSGYIRSFVSSREIRRTFCSPALDKSAIYHESLTPTKIVEELDRFIIGQLNAKKAVAVALRNRWRRQQLDSEFRKEVKPTNILMMGPTGSGKTEIARRLATIYKAPFSKVEVTKFTETGVVGTDTEECIHTLVAHAVRLEKKERKETLRPIIDKAVEDRLMIALKKSDNETRAKLRAGGMDDAEVEIEVQKKNKGMNLGKMMGGGKRGRGGMMGGQGGVNLFDMLGGGSAKEKAKMSIKEAREILEDEELDKKMNPEELNRTACRRAEEQGIVFLDEIDKLSTSNDIASNVGAGSRGTSGIKGEGVQKELLGLVEGTVVHTDYGDVNTDHILFIASGAFHVSKPTDLLPELQGRLPIRVELEALTQSDFVKILTMTHANLLEQQKLLMATEKVNVDFTENGVNQIAKVAHESNQSLENIGARRLQSVLATVMDDISFKGPLLTDTTQTIDEEYVKERVQIITKKTDLSKYIL